jgi:hypothetical protein
MSDASAPTVANARRMGATALREAGRARARRALSRGGARIASLDQSATAHWVIVQSIRRAIPRRLDAAAARGLEATFELRVRKPAGGEPERFALRISDGACTATPGPAADAGAVATLGADDIVRLASGSVGWPELLSDGRLELSGDPFLALRFPTLFRLPAKQAAP